MSRKNMFSFLDEPVPFFEPHNTSRSQVSLGTATSRSSVSSRTWKESVLEPRPSFSKASLESPTRWGGFVPRGGMSWGSDLHQGKKPRPASRICPPKRLEYGTVLESMRAWSQGRVRNFRFIGRYQPRKVVVTCGDSAIDMYYCDSAFHELHEREKERKLRATGIFGLDSDGDTRGTLEGADL